MHVFYEEDGGFKVGTVLVDNVSSLQVEAQHGKRSKVKSAAVVLRFGEPGLGAFLEAAHAVEAGIDPGFLWEVAPQEEFDFLALAREYFGHDPSQPEAAGLLMRLHGAPMHFYKKGKGRYRAAPPDALKAALASVERKRQQAETQAAYVAALARGELPEAFGPLLDELLYEPDRGSIQYKAVEAAAVQAGLSPLHLLARAGAVPSSHDFHLRRFLRDHFPGGTVFPDAGELPSHDDLPLAAVEAFSIDDASTTEIDDALSVVPHPGGGWQVGVHIAAPALGLAPGSLLDAAAAARQSTVYLPGSKITMLPEAVIDRYTLREGGARPVVSLYAYLDESLAPLGFETRVERVHVAANLRHDEIESRFTEQAIAAGALDFPFGPALARLHAFALRLEADRGRPELAPEKRDYAFYVEDGRVRIVERRRGSPMDRLVAELMILVNAHWGGELAEARVPAIYRVQNGGRTRMSLAPAPHEGLGVEQYAWSSSPLRRYVDLVNQRQIIARAQGEDPPYRKGADDLGVVVRDFEAAYEAYAEFQRQMERYWCLRWVEQESAWRTRATVLRENLVRLERIPLFTRVPSLPPDVAPGSAVEVEISAIDYLSLDFDCRFVARA